MSSEASVSWPWPRVSPQSVGLCPDRLAKAAGFVQGMIDRQTLAGAITLIARRGGIAHLQCHGWQDIESNTPMRQDAIFRIYSMTKPIVCCAILMLYEECALWPQDPVSKFLPEFANLMVNTAAPGTAPLLVPPKREVTIHDLLTHTGGLSYALASDWGQTGKSSAEFVTEFCKVPLLGHPGQTWRYSSSNDVLGRVIEVISGQRLDAFLAERIFRPLGMTDTGFFAPPEKQHRLATLYQHDEDAKVIRREKEDRDYRHDPAFCSGGGGLVSTTADYLRFCLMLLNGGQLDGVRLLSPKTVELMRTDHLPPGHGPIEPYKFGYGYGVSVVRSLTEKQNIASVGEFGWGGAAGTNAWIDPHEQMVSLFMIQLKPSKVPMIDHRVKIALTAAVVG
jgi:CubicO group peptidase (beta-lactamase class C family)